MPHYVSEKVKDNRRRFATTAKVQFVVADVSAYHLIFQFQQQDSVLFTVRNGVDGAYDAYQKDIAIASFYFEEPMAYEYTRYVEP